MSLKPSLNIVDRDFLLKRGYSIVRPLSRGSSAYVYLFQYNHMKENEAEGQDNAPPFPSSPIELACKVIETNNVPKDFATKFLVRELDIISKIKHPNIIHVHSILQRNTKYMVFMRFAENGNLCDFLVSHGALKEKQAKLWTRQILVAMLYLHALDIVHRDIKCENIVITANHNAKLTDFGFTRFAVDKKGAPLKSATFCGSLAYAAPELIKGVPYDPKKTDAWALGVVIFIMFNIAMPFNTDNLKNLSKDQYAKNFRFRSKVAVKTSPEAIELVNKLLEPDVATRATLDYAFSESPWMSADPKLQTLTAPEATALQKGLEHKDEMRSKTLKKLSRSHDLIVLSREVYYENSTKLTPSVLVNKSILPEDPV